MRTKVFIAEIEIREKCWHWKVGDIVNVPIIAQSKRIADKMIDDKFCGSEFPHYRVLSISEYAGDFLFNMLVQKASKMELASL